MNIGAEAAISTIFRLTFVASSAIIVINIAVKQGGKVNA